MIKKLLGLAAILLLFTSCILTPIEEEKPKYVGTWSKISSSNDYTTTSLRLAISENSYSVYLDTLVKLTGTLTKNEIERGSLSNPTATSFTLTRTHLFENDSLVKIPDTLQESRTVLWSVFSNELTLQDSKNLYTVGSFTKE